MSFPVAPTATLILLRWYLVTGAIECDEKRLWQNPIACEHSLPCLFMAPVIQEVYPTSFAIKEICKLMRENCKHTNKITNGSVAEFEL